MLSLKKCVMHRFALDAEGCINKYIHVPRAAQKKYTTTTHTFQVAVSKKLKPNLSFITPKK